MQSTLERIHMGTDIVCRAFLKLIQQMHQDQVIEELLGDEKNDGDLLDGTKSESQSGQNVKKKKKKKKAAATEELKVSEQSSSETGTPKK
jgi:hypothetical protein